LMDTRVTSESEPLPLILSKPSCSYTSKNYVNTSAPDYVYYVRKHNPTIIYDSVASVPSRLARHRNFNDFAADVNASALPQWMFVTPNLVNDAHDTSVDYAASWLQYWLVPLLGNPNFNDNGTLVVLTFDENESYTENNCVLALLLGGAVPESARGTTDSTYYTHYSLLSTVEANWGLGSLGRGDTNKYVSTLYSHPRLVKSHHVPQDPLERLLLRRISYRIHKRERIQFRCPHEPDWYHTRPAQPGALRALHRAKHIRCRSRWRIRLCCTRSKHKLYRSGRTASGQPHPAEQDATLVRPAYWFERRDKLEQRQWKWNVKWRSGRERGHHRCRYFRHDARRSCDTIDLKSGLPRSFRCYIFVSSEVV
jgi:hypothetical protein